MTLKEKISEILYWWSMKTFYKKGDKIQKADDIADQILSTLIEALPKEKIECVLTEGTRKYNIANDYPEDFCPPNERYVGFNEALNTIKELLK
jgi:hypothetical protein